MNTPLRVPLPARPRKSSAVRPGGQISVRTGCGQHRPGEQRYGQREIGASRLIIRPGFAPMRGDHRRADSSPPAAGGHQNAHQRERPAASPGRLDLKIRRGLQLAHQRLDGRRGLSRSAAAPISACSRRACQRPACDRSRCSRLQYQMPSRACASDRGTFRPQAAQRTIASDGLSPRRRRPAPERDHSSRHRERSPQQDPQQQARHRPSLPSVRGHRVRPPRSAFTSYPICQQHFDTTGFRCKPAAASRSR